MRGWSVKLCGLTVYPLRKRKACVFLGPLSAGCNCLRNLEFHQLDTRKHASKPWMICQKTLTLLQPFWKLVWTDSCSPGISLLEFSAFHVRQWREINQRIISNSELLGELYSNYKFAKMTTGTWIAALLWYGVFIYCLNISLVLSSPNICVYTVKFT